MLERPFRAKLKQEYQKRRAKNPRYSLRTFVAFLGTDHSTLSQILRGARRVPVKQMSLWAKRLKIDREEIAAYIAAEHLPDPATAARQHQLQHWAAEAMSIMADRTHWHILQLCRTAHFRPDCRWIAEQIGSTVDQVNFA